jgi:diguanylate cyclase (GGDEF)-like protein
MASLLDYEVEQMRPSGTEGNLRDDWGTIEPSTRQAKRAAFWALCIALVSVAIAVGTQLFLSAHITQSLDRVQAIAALAGELLLHDDRLTNTAYLAIVTGDRAWIDEYELASARMDHALSKAASVAPPELKHTIDETRKANDELVEMEQRAFERLQAGDRDGARMLLANTDYRMQKEVLANDLRSLRNQLSHVATVDGERLRHLFSWVVLGVSALIVSGFIFAWWRIRVTLTRTTAAFKASQSHLRWVATHDELTGIPNRRLFIERKCVRRDALKDDERLAVFILDLDRFKPVNDRYGHRVGDEVVKVIAKRLADIVDAEKALLARIGGDEFGVLLNFTVDDANAPPNLAERMLQVTAQPVHLANLSIEIGLSIGCAVTSSKDAALTPFASLDGSREETTLRHADMALQAAKSEGRGRYRCFEPAMDQKLFSRVELEGEIEQAIETGQIVPFYQPIVDMRSERVVGYEVLARWKHPTRVCLCRVTSFQSRRVPEPSAQ